SIVSDDGSIVFYEHFRAPLLSGDYEVTVRQTVQSTDAGNAFAETFENRATFAVQGARFTLRPEDVQSQFPPPDAQGDFSNVLSHIVLHSRTLPWQRSIGQTADSTILFPWLAVLTFDLEDPIPDLHTGSIADLLPSRLPQGTISYPSLTLEYGEAESDPILYIDVAIELFTTIVPRQRDLPWLAHGRVISLENAGRKGDRADGALPTEFSVVVSNRLPKPGNQTAIFLVSLESMAAYLPDSGSALTPGSTAIRLAVLASWSFGCVPRGETFGAYLTHLNRQPGTPQIPYEPSGETRIPEVERALAMGYAAFDHFTRQGAATVSWYRGPLLPFTNPVDIEVPISSSDALTHYDPATGMFDLSLGTAWQIGQLLALADKDFAQLLYSWKRTQTREAVVAFEREFLGRRFAVDPARLRGDERLHLQLMREAIRPLLRKFVETKKTP
ncbi:MAG TPA: hypothetical protein VFO89_07455, partial [Thermoanaerobaculia bacterium]|nr:hypothetical protein [Thermoanaerobaculia bacterium]